MGKEGVVVLVCLVIMFMLMSFTSAGLLDWFGKITGKATQQNTNVTITIAGAAAVTIEVFNETLTDSAVLPTSDTFKAISFIVRVNDSDGYSDINVTSVTANFTKTGEVTRVNSSCSDNSENTVYSKNFTCTINVWYFDTYGPWTINVAAKDLGNTSLVVNSSRNVTIGTLQNFEMSNNLISFPSSAQGATNVTANSPSQLNNTGNYDFTGVNVTGYNLIGESAPSVFINVGNLTVGNNTGLNSCDVSNTINANATVLVNGTTRNVRFSTLPRGNHSVNNNATGQETVYYCFNYVPAGLQSQVYSTTYTGGQWELKVLN